MVWMYIEQFVNSEYDKGTIIRQTKVAVDKTDTAESLSAKVQRAEKIQLVNVINDFINGNLWPNFLGLF